MDDRLDKFFQKYNNSEMKNKKNMYFPAIDIGAERAIYTTTMAMRWRPPVFEWGRELIWYPTDYDSKELGDGGTVEKDTREALRYQIQESEESTKVLFVDRNGQEVFPDDMVTLEGLKSVHYNGRMGYVRGPDPKSQGRYGVQLSDDDSNDKKSFKPCNLVRAGDSAHQLHELNLHAMKQQGIAKEFFQGLLDRTREIDILDHETWSNVQEVRGQCALVTCTHLISCIGYRAPTAWQDTLEFAAQYLREDGYLLQMDVYREAGMDGRRIDTDFSNVGQ